MVKHLRAGRPHCTSRNLDVKATLGVFFSPEGGVVVWLATSLPVTYCLPNCLEDAAKKDNSK